MGSSFVEAMAAGLPVLATPGGGLRDFLFDLERNSNSDRQPTGLFVNVNDPESIARQAKRLIDDQDLRARIAANGRALASEKYDWALVARDMRDTVFSQVFP